VSKIGAGTKGERTAILPVEHAPPPSAEKNHDGGGGGGGLMTLTLVAWGTVWSAASALIPPKVIDNAPSDTPTNRAARSPIKSVGRVYAATLNPPNKMSPILVVRGEAQQRSRRTAPVSGGQPNSWSYSHSFFLRAKGVAR
jgi:hypothetical protein